MRNRKIYPFEITLIVSVLSLLFFRQMPNIYLEEDEIYFITSSAQLEEWVNLETDADSWKVNYWTLSAPPLPKYIIAIGRLLGGFQRDELFIPYNNSLSYQENFTAGNVPSDKLLIFSRTPMVILAVLTGLLLYYLFLYGINRIAAILWLVLFASNCALESVLLLAMSEAPLLLFSMLSFIFVFVGQRQLHSYLQNDSYVINIHRIYLFFVLAGVNLGMAAASKIHAFVFLLPFGVLLIYSIFVPKSPSPSKMKFAILVRVFSICCLFALITFILLNPSLYLNPIKGVGWMFQFRMMAVDWQLERNQQFVSLSIFQRWMKILHDLMTTNASISGGLGLYVNSAFSILGIYLLIRSLITSIKRRLPLELLPSLMVYLSVMILAAFMSPLDWLRYFLFPIIGVMLLITYSTAYLFEKVLSFVKKSARSKVPAG